MESRYGGYGGVEGTQAKVAGRNLSEGAKLEQAQSSSLTNGINERTSKLHDMAGRLEALADRIVGQEPPKPVQTSGELRATPGHLTARLDMCCEGLDFVGTRIEDAIRRLERFA